MAGWSRVAAATREGGRGPALGLCAERPESSRLAPNTQDHASKVDPKVSHARSATADPSAKLVRRLVLDGLNEAPKQRSRSHRVARLDGAQVLGRQLLRTGREQGTLLRNLTDFHRKDASF